MGGQYLSFTSDYRVFFGSNTLDIADFEELKKSTPKMTQFYL